MLATGGAAALWSRTTNPPGSYGSGLLLARAAGAVLADLEFVQFHPTAVTGVKGREGFLISEAVRGEGATLHDGSGERFADELRPRDEVARAIVATMRSRGEPCVWLDMRAVDPGRFPNVVAALREAGLDPARERVPVAPASHYVMGGIACDLHGRTAVGGLLRDRRVRLHGPARRQPPGLELALGVLRVRAPGRAVRRSTSRHPHAAPPPRGDPPSPPSRTTREATWQHAGLERDAEGLERLLGDPHPLARLVAASALARCESRGAHAADRLPGTRSGPRRPPLGGLARRRGQRRNMDLGNIPRPVKANTKLIRAGVPAYTTQSQAFAGSAGDPREL